MINISKVINDKNLKKNLPTQFTKTEKISAVYTLTKTMRSKIFNHEEFVKTLDTKDILDNMYNLPCNCTTSSFTDPNHGKIVTGGIRIVQNNTLRKLLCEGLKYREQVSVNFSNGKTEIKNCLIKFYSEWCIKKGVSVKCFTQRISLVMEKAKKRIKELKDRFKCSKVKQVLKDKNVISYLKTLQEQYVMCPIDTYQQVNNTLHNVFQQQ